MFEQDRVSTIRQGKPVFLRRLLTLLALAGSVASCTVEGTPSQDQAAATPASRVSVPPPSRAAVERLIGGLVYDEPRLQAYVDGVGQRVVRRGEVPGGSYRFHVLDMPTPNAHALSSGHVFVTRGLLAMLDDEAELAAALAHELGHLSRRHAAERARHRQTMLEAVLEAVRTTGSIAVGSSVAREGLLAIRRYSREQELDADRAALAYIRQAGYRADAVLSLIEKLRRQARLEAALRGFAPEALERPSALSTHPADQERIAALRALPPLPGGETGRDAFLAAIEGMPVDDSPEEGFVRDNAFLHPVLRLAFTAPGDFRLDNGHDGVRGFGRDRTYLYFSCIADRVGGSLVDWVRNEVKPTPSHLQPTEIGGAEAVIGERPRGSDTGSATIRQVFIRRPDGLCYFTLIVDGFGNDRRMESLIAAARTFRTLDEHEAAALRPHRLRVVSAGAVTAAQLAARLPYRDFRMERLLALNGVDSAAELATRASIKTIEP
jgi:predicted Zn-dependent protease